MNGTNRYISCITAALSAIANGLFCQRFSKKKASIISSSAIILAAICASIVFYDVGIKGNIVHILLAKWLNIRGTSVSWAIYVDQLTSIMFIVVTWVSAIVHIYSLGYMGEDEGLAKFLSFLSFFTFFMLTLVSADNFLQLFFGWEGVGLCSYLLIGFWYTKDSANAAAVKAFIVNRVGDFAFILGVIMIIIYSGHADFATVFAKTQDLSNVIITIFSVKFAALDIICLLLFLGCMGKSAQIGLHVWLPDAMEGPTPVSALIHAATMVTAGVFLVARCSYLFEYSPQVLQIIAVIGGITCLFAATIAVAQTDIKRIIAYSTCSQLGYMFLACGVSAYQAGIFHLVTHAFFKALLFLSAGTVIHSCHEQDIFKIGGLKDKLPITYTNFWLGSVAIIGIYPLSGFYSKDLILESAYGSGFTGEFVFWLGIIAAVLTAIYSMKIIIMVFHSETKLKKDVFEHIHEAPKIMNIPLTILVAGTLFAGMLGYYILNLGEIDGYFRSSIFNLHVKDNLHNTHSLIKMLPMIVGLFGIFIGVYIYQGKNYYKLSKNFSYIHCLLKNKYYFDEIYNLLIVRPILVFSNLMNFFDQKIVDRFGPSGMARATNCLGCVVSRLQTGYISNYALIVLLTLVVCITIFVVNFIKVI